VQSIAESGVQVGRCLGHVVIALAFVLLGVFLTINFDQVTKSWLWSLWSPVSVSFLLIMTTLCSWASSSFWPSSRFENQAGPRGRGA